MTWSALLTDDARATALFASRRIADQPRSAMPMPEAASLPGGAAGDALLHHYLALCAPSEVDDARARDLIENATAALGGEPMGFGLLQGVTGIAWVAHHLVGDDPDDPIAPIDDALLDLLGSPVRSFDLVFGLVGYAVYALDRLPRPTARRCLDAIAGQLGQLAHLDQHGACWATHDDAGVRFDLGLAHGTAGVIAVLARLVAAGFDVAPLLRDAIAWIRGQRRATKHLEFPSVVLATGETLPSELAWCRGDPGLAVALLMAACALDDRELECEAIALACACAVRSERCSIGATHLCHGTAGLGHVFNRLYQATGEPSLGRAAKHWFERTLERWQPGDAGLLQGDIGVALALLAAATDVEPQWDRTLLLSPYSGK